MKRRARAVLRFLFYDFMTKTDATKNMYTHTHAHTCACICIHMRSKSNADGLALASSERWCAFNQAGSGEPDLQVNFKCVLLP